MKTLKALVPLCICLFIISCDRDSGPKTETQPVATSRAVPDAPRPQADTGEGALAELCRGAISEQWENFHTKKTVLGTYTFEADENGTWMSWPWSGYDTGNGKVVHTREVTFCHVGKDGESERITGGEGYTPEWWKLSSAQAASSEGHKAELLKSGLPEKCRAYVRSLANSHNLASVSFDEWSQEFTKEDSQFVIWRINFTGKNYFNTDIPYTATCTLDESLEFYGNIQRR